MRRNPGGVKVVGWGMSAAKRSTGWRASRWTAWRRSRSILQSGPGEPQNHQAAAVDWQRAGGGRQPDASQRAAERCAESWGSPGGSTEVYVVSGMGGGTGSGAAPVVARWPGRPGPRFTAVVTRPFSFEGTLRASTAARGIARWNSGSTAGGFQRRPAAAFLRRIRRSIRPTPAGAGALAGRCSCIWSSDSAPRAPVAPAAGGC